jgi:hypothetical protein
MSFYFRMMAEWARKGDWSGVWTEFEHVLWETLHIRFHTPR